VKVQLLLTSHFTVFAGSCFNNEIDKEVLFYETLKEKCTAEDTFLTVNDFFNNSNVLLKNCGSVTTNGAAGIKNVFQGKFIELA